MRDRVQLPSFTVTCQPLVGNIRVFCRVRPMIKEDGVSTASVLAVDCDDEDVLVVANSKGRSQTFEMDRLFMPDFSQKQVRLGHAS